MESFMLSGSMSEDNPADEVAHLDHEWKSYSDRLYAPQDAVESWRQASELLNPDTDLTFLSLTAHSGSHEAAIFLEESALRPDRKVSFILSDAQNWGPSEWLAYTQQHQSENHQITQMRLNAKDALQQFGPSATDVIWDRLGYIWYTAASADRKGDLARQRTLEVLSMYNELLKPNGIVIFDAATKHMSYDAFKSSLDYRHALNMENQKNRPPLPKRAIASLSRLTGLSHTQPEPDLKELDTQTTLNLMRERGIGQMEIPTSQLVEDLIGVNAWGTIEQTCNFKVHSVGTGIHAIKVLQKA
jgi:hypothetical protein